MNINKISDEAVEAVAAKLFPDLFSEDSLIPSVLANSGRWQRRHEVRAALEAAADVLPRFTYTEEDLLSLARGVVPEWLRFDADAALDEELAK